MSETPTPEVSHQVLFGDDGLEIEDQTETTFSDWGFGGDDRDRETRYEKPRASSFGVDDRKVVKASEHEQATIFPNVDEDQVTLGGDRAATRSKW